MYLIAINTLNGWKRTDRQLYPLKRDAEVEVYYRTVFLGYPNEYRIFDADHEPGRTLSRNGVLPHV